MTELKKPKYLKLANELAQLIESGTFRVGDRLPSIRELAVQWRISMTTVSEAYRDLENRGLVESRPQSGFFVLSPWVRTYGALENKPLCSTPILEPVPQEPRLTDFMLKLIQDMHKPTYLPLGGAVLMSSDVPSKRLYSAAQTAGRRHEERINQYCDPSGVVELKSEIAKRAVLSGVAADPSEVLITNGCHEGISLAISALSQPGDMIAVESPCFYVTIFSAIHHARKIVEIPCSPETGISLEALEFALKSYPIRVVVTVSNHQNPMGSSIPDERKKALVELCEQHGVVLIEDDIYGELCYNRQRPRTCKSYDQTGNVVLCSSFSKTVAPGYRIGWVLPGRYRKEILTHKLLLNISTSVLPQLTLSTYLEEGGYDHHLRRLRRSLGERMELLRRMVGECFPPETRLSNPSGGLVLWVEFWKGFDSFRLYGEALREGISIGPGGIFSQSGQYKHCIRLNCTGIREEHLEQLQLLARLIECQRKPIIRVG